MLRKIDFSYLFFCISTRQEYSNNNNGTDSTNVRHTSDTDKKPNIKKNCRKEKKIRGEIFVCMERKKKNKKRK